MTKRQRIHAWETEKKAREETLKFVERMVQERFASTKHNDDEDQQVLLSQLLEQLIYATSPTMKEYMDKSNMEEKIERAAMRILMRRLQKRRRAIGQFRTSIMPSYTSSVVVCPPSGSNSTTSSSSTSSSMSMKLSDHTSSAVGVTKLYVRDVQMVVAARSMVAKKN